MSDALDNFRNFYKAQTIRDPMGLATYVKEKYGVPDKSVFQVARGIAGKSRAKQWNPVGSGGGKGGAGSAVPKGYRHAGRGSKRAVVRRKKPKFSGRQGRMKLSVDMEKADTVKDSRRLSHHLAAKYGKPWKDFEGGIRGKQNAKEWNPIQNPDVQGFEYDSSGMKRRKRDEKKEDPKAKRRAAAQKGAKTRARKRAAGYGTQRRLPGFAKKSMDTLLKAKGHKFGGKPLGWDDLPRDPIAFATNVMQDKGFKLNNLAAGSKGASLRNKLSQGIRRLINEVPDATKKEIKQGRQQDQKDYKRAKKLAQQQEDSWKEGDPPPMVTTERVDEEYKELKKQPVSPALARLLGFGAGWAMSDTFVEAPRGQMTPSQQRDWERLVRSSMRRKKGLQKDAIDALRTHYEDSSDTYVRRKPIQNSLDIAKQDIEKDHAPVPPRQGLVWDEQKKHWSRPENVGHTVSEVQGKKRVRGTGTGVHERSRAAGGIGGKGAGMSAQAGRRFRSAADVGIIKPHSGKHPSTRHTKARKNIIQNVLARRGHRTRP